MDRDDVYSQPAHDTATNTEWQLQEAVLIQFVSPDDEDDMLETCRELQYINTLKGICVSSWAITKNHQQHVSAIQTIFRLYTKSW